MSIGARLYSAPVPSNGIRNWLPGANNASRMPRALAGQPLVSATGALLPSLRCARASTATYIDHAGVMQTAPANTPRVDWSTGKPELLVEGEGTNIFSENDDFTNPSFDPNYWSTVPSTAVSPLYAGATILAHTLVAEPTDPNSGYLVLPTDLLTSFILSAWIWLPSGHPFTGVEFISNGNAVNLETLVAASISVTSAWQRISAIALPGGGSITPMIGSFSTAASGVFYSTMWDVQAGNVLTSNIPTTGTPAARAADVLYAS